MSAMKAKQEPSTDRDLIYAIGIKVLVNNYNYPHWSVQKWIQRGIPWKYRARLRYIAARRGYKTPRKFLEDRKSDLRPPSKAVRDGTAARIRPAKKG